MTTTHTEASNLTYLSLRLAERELAGDQRYDLREHLGDTITLRVAGIDFIASTAEARRVQRRSGLLDSDGMLGLMRAAGQDTAPLEQALVDLRAKLTAGLERDEQTVTPDALNLDALNGCGIDYDDYDGTLTIPARY